MVAGLHFLVTTDIQKPDPQLRKFIRSKVMLGKNLGKSRSSVKKLRSPKKPRKSSKSHISKPHAEVNVNCGETSEPSTSNNFRFRRSTSTDTCLAAIAPLPLPPLRKFGWDIGPLCVADNVDNSSVEVFLRCATLLLP